MKIKGNLLKLPKLLEIGKYLSHHWMLHVNFFYWALDHFSAETFTVHG